MIGPTVETRFFEARKQKLLMTNPDEYAVISGRRLLGIFATLDAALAAVAAGFDHCNIPPGRAILITQISEAVTLRVMAAKGPARSAAAFGAAG